MSARRQFLRGLALLPAALKPAAEAIAAQASSMSRSVPPAPGHYIGSGEQRVDDSMGSLQNAARKQAQKMLGVFARKRDRQQIGQMAGIDLDLWAIRSYSPVFRAMRQGDRVERDRVETRGWRKIIGYLEITDEEA